MIILSSPEIGENFQGEVNSNMNYCVFALKLHEVHISNCTKFRFNSNVDEEGAKYSNSKLPRGGVLIKPLICNLEESVNSDRSDTIQAAA